MLQDNFAEPPPVLIRLTSVTRTPLGAMDTSKATTQLLCVQCGESAEKCRPGHSLNAPQRLHFQFLKSFDAQARSQIGI